MKRSRLRKKGKQPISVIQRKLWELCKLIIRHRYPNVCYTCGAPNLMGSNWQTGHMWPKASLGAYMKYDLRILRPQCSVCNIWRGGMGAEYYKRMLEENGASYMRNLEKDRLVTVKAYDHYVTLLSEYTKVLQNYEQTHYKTARHNPRRVQQSPLKRRGASARIGDVLGDTVQKEETPSPWDEW